MAKRVDKEQNLELRYKALKLELEKCKTNKEVAQLFGVPANKLFTLKKNKEKILQAFQQGNATTKRVKTDTYDQVNEAVLKCFKRLRSENVPVSGVLIKEKALVEELTFENFQASDRRLNKWKRKLGLTFFISDSFAI